MIGRRPVLGLPAVRRLFRIREQKHPPTRVAHIGGYIPFDRKPAGPSAGLRLAECVLQYAVSAQRAGIQLVDDSNVGQRPITIRTSFTRCWHSSVWVLWDLCAGETRSARRATSSSRGIACISCHYRMGTDRCARPSVSLGESSRLSYRHPARASRPPDPPRRRRSPPRWRRRD